jgi:hypothetical protein
MRRRINRTLLTATAASVSVITLGFMATGAVGAATTTTGLASGTSIVTPILTDTTCVPTTAPGLPSDNCARAGWQASGRDFRYAAASIVVPDHVGAVAPDPALYVALDDSGDVYDYARVGIKPCPTTNITGSGDATCPNAASPGTGVDPSGWAVFAKVVVNGGTPTTFSAALPALAVGLGVSVSAYLEPSGNWVRFSITTPNTTSLGGGLGKSYNRSMAVSGPVYTDALAVADWTGIGTSSITEPVQPVLGSANTSAYDQFFQGRFTTWSGTQGTFNGKWTVTKVEATTNGLAPSGTSLATGPSYLWSNDKYPHDAFGVWIYHS